MSIGTGTRLGPYTILAPLGKGGMGEVYRARDERLGRDVAIKVLPAGGEADQAALSRFEREARAVAALSHSNVVAIYDVGRHEGVPFVVMELLEGNSLRDQLKNGRLAPETTIEYARQVVAGLAAAHAKGIVHRDIKPENIFITVDGQLKLLDFGLARVTADQSFDAGGDTISRLTTPGLVVGTLGYMSPEQVHGEAVDARSDIFSFGCVLYEMLAGRRPFTGDSAVRLMTAIARDEPPPIPTPLPDSLHGILRRCLAKRPEERYASAAELRRDLDSSSGRDRQGLTASAPTIVLDRTRKRRFPLFAAAASVAILIAAATVLTLLPRLRTSATPLMASAQQKIDSIAVLPFTNLSGSREDEYLADGVTEEIINALARVRGLNVVSRTSSFALKGQDLDVAQIAARLGVGALVDGSVQRAGDRLRIRAQLVDATNSYQLWSHSFDGQMTDIFAFQDEIATKVASALEAEIGATRSSAPTRDIAAYELYLRGREASRFWTREGLERAISSFTAALQRDPSFVEAWAGLADTYSVLDHAQGATSLTPEESYRLATQSAERALAIDPNSSEAHAALGHILTHQGDFTRADEHLRRAVELNPNSALARLWYSVFLRTVTRYDESRAQTLRAKELDPLSGLILSVGGNNFWYMGDASRMLEFAAALEGVAPGSAESHRLRSRAYSLLGRHDEALREIEMVRRPDDRQRLDEEVILVLAHAGRHEEMRERIEAMLQEASPSGSAPAGVRLPWRPSLLMRAHAAAGDLDQAARWLRVYVETQPNYARVNLDLPPHPAYEAFRRDPRYIAARGELGVPGLQH